MPAAPSGHPAMDVTPIVLQGNRVLLEPLTQQHLPELAEIAFVPSIWRWTHRRIDTQQDLQTFFRIALGEIEAGTGVVWVTRSKATGKLAGSTRLYDISQHHHTMELGGTWLHPDHHRTGINVEAKYLQLTHAFERMGAQRVSFKTHHENLKSQAAIAAVGAKFEGIFRNHMIMPDGSIRHSYWYSIIREDWPEVKSGFKARLSRFQGQPGASLRAIR